VAIGMALTVGVSQAAESGPPMPEKVRAFMDRLVGTWIFDGSAQGTGQVRWDPAAGVLVDTGQFREGDVSGSWSGIWYWDGVSDDGLIVCWSSQSDRGFAHGQIRGKVLSETTLEGQRTGIRQGKPASAKIRITFENPGRYVWRGTNAVLGGESEPDYTDIYTKGKGVTPKDFEEFCKLNEGAWRGETPLEADIPGVGKEGETVTVHYHYARVEDGAALIGKSYWPDGTHTWFLAYDEAHKRIRSIGISSIYGLTAHDVHYSNRTWTAQGTRARADGTEAHFDLTGVFDKSGNKLTVTGSRISDGKKVEFVDVWHRMNQ